MLTLVILSKGKALTNDENIYGMGGKKVLRQHLRAI